MKPSLKIEYPPLYELLIWSSKNATVQQINCATKSFTWDRSFTGKNDYDLLYSFNKIILNIFCHFIPNKIIICDDKDPPWFNDEIHQTLNKKNELF